MLYFVDDESEYQAQLLSDQLWQTLPILVPLLLLADPLPLF